MPRAFRDDASTDEAPAGAALPRACDHPGCDGSGDFKAPKSRRGDAGHYWFCLTHIRDFNAGWDFFAGMDQGQIARFQQANNTWHRPTWQFGMRPGGTAGGEPWVDPLDLFGAARMRQPDREPQKAQRVLPAEERQALSVLELSSSATLQEIKSRYKQLVKRFHPDANGGDKAAEERLKRINQAYTYLLSCGYS